MGARGPLKLPPQLAVVPAERGQAEETMHTRLSPAAPEPPESLPEDARPWWESVVSALDEAGLVGRCDAATLELALRHYMAAVKASDELLALAAVAVWDEKNGRLAKHPSSQVFRDHSTAFLAFAKELGLTFVSRARVPTGDKGDGDGAGRTPFG